MMEGEAAPEEQVNGGRPMHAHWDGFTKVYVRGKVAVKCGVCSKTQLNTSKVRLIAHR